MTRGREAGRAALRGIGLATLAAAWAGTATLAYATMVERHAYRLREVEAPVLAPGAAPIRILHLSDLHLAPWQRRRIAWVRGLAALEPDLVVNTGDNLSHRDAIPALRETLLPFAGVPGVVVHGSNDYYGPVFKNPLAYLIPALGRKKDAPKLDAETMDAMFERELGWPSIDNDAIDVEAAGRRLRFVALGDPHIRLDDVAGADAGLARLAAAATPEPDIVLGAVHAPYARAVEALIARGAVLVLAGHTHGGQVAVPGYGAIISNCDLPPRFAKGLAAWEAGEGPSAIDATRPRTLAAEPARRALLHVSGGLGTSLFAPFRLASPPEATLITLTARDASAAAEPARRR